MQKNSVYILVISVLGLVVLGLVVLSSTSAFAEDSHGDTLYFVRKQAIWLALGAVVVLGAALVDYHWWRYLVWVVFGLAIVMLVLCFLPPIGQRINGSSRWINLGFSTFQPSEFAKFAAIAFLAYWFSKYEKESGTFLKGFVFPGLIVAAMLGLIVTEVDIGSTMLISGTMIAMMFVAGTSLRYLAVLGVMGLAGVVGAVSLIGERLGRVMAFMDLEKYQYGGGLQQYQGLIALGSGGIEGLGLGNGRQKMLYLPYAHTDFIFPMIGEELGLRFTLAIVSLYLLIFLCGACISVNARDRFGLLFGFGITVIMSLQAAVNIGVTTALLPNKGLPLPFISYGGSNLLLCLLGVGILINIYRQGLSTKPTTTSNVLRARVLPRL